MPSKYDALFWNFSKFLLQTNHPSIESSSPRIPNYSLSKSVIFGPLLKDAQVFKHGTNNVMEKHIIYAHVFISAEVGREDLEFCPLNSICDPKRANSTNWKSSSVE